MKESLTMKGHILYETSSQKIQILGNELVNVGVWYPGPIKQNKTKNKKIKKKRNAVWAQN